MVLNEDSLSIQAKKLLGHLICFLRGHSSEISACIWFWRNPGGFTEEVTLQLSLKDEQELIGEEQWSIQRDHLESL